MPGGAHGGRAIGDGLAFAGLNQLCAPMLSRTERLPVPQRDALRYASGLVAGPSPDGFLVGLAVLNLLAWMAGERPSSASAPGANCTPHWRRRHSSYLLVAGGW
jgi:hypothetical protein